MADERRPPAAEPAAASEPRRGFMTRFAAALVGTLVGVIPLLAAGVTFIDPLLRKKRQNGDEDTATDGFLKITTIGSLPADGTPRMFPVIADLQDAWNKFPNTEVGSVYLWQNSEGMVSCFNARCPHLGCTVNFKSDQSAYVCPCHDSAFSLNGERSNDIPPRDMDPLDAEIRNGDEVWVRFQKFRAGIHERQAV
jgi:menaquinol-cytochrome c reductase iron-sulfur subunit